MPRTSDGIVSETTQQRGTPAGGPAPRSSAPVKLHRPDVSLADKYLLEQGTVFLSGTQALVRVLLDQVRADRRRGLLRTRLHRRQNAKRLEPPSTGMTVPVT